MYSFVTAPYYLINAVEIKQRLSRLFRVVRWIGQRTVVILVEYHVKYPLRIFTFD